MTEDLLKVKTLLKTRGCSDRTVTNYISCINRFKNYFKGKDIQNFQEEDILIYVNDNFVKLGFSAASINVNRAAIKYYGLLSNRGKNSLIKLCRILIGQVIFSDFTSTLERKLFEFTCPYCGSNKFYYSFFYHQLC